MGCIQVIAGAVLTSVCSLTRDYLFMLMGFVVGLLKSVIKTTI